MPERTVIVGMDLNEPSIVAAQWASRHLAKDATLVLAHAIHVPEPPSFLRGLYPPTDQLIENARQGAEDRLRGVAGTLGDAKLRTEIRVGRGDEVLVDLATELAAELIVVGLHGARAGIWKVLGSTAERVARRASTSVLLARRLPDDGPRSILVALDESRLMPLAIDWSKRLATHPDAQTVLLHVAKPARIAQGDDERERFEREVRARTTEWMKTQTEGAGLRRTRLEVQFGDPAFELLSAVERLGVDLLVIGRHGAGRETSGFMGSVVEFLLRNGSEAVLVVGQSASP